jgi:iron complex outermembrane receptor protein
LTGSVDSKRYKDLIFPVPAAATQSSVTRFKNLPGNLLNKGFEVSLNYKVIDKEDFVGMFLGMLHS